MFPEPKSTILFCSPFSITPWNSTGCVLQVPDWGGGQTKSEFCEFCEAQMYSWKITISTESPVPSWCFTFSFLSVVLSSLHLKNISFHVKGNIHILCKVVWIFLFQLTEDKSGFQFLKKVCQTLPANPSNSNLLKVSPLKNLWEEKSFKLHYTGKIIPGGFGTNRKMEWDFLQGHVVTRQRGMV